MVRKQTVSVYLVWSILVLVKKKVLQYAMDKQSNKSIDLGRES